MFKSTSRIYIYLVEGTGYFETWERQLFGRCLFGEEYLTKDFRRDGFGNDPLKGLKEVLNCEIYCDLI